MNTKAPRSAQTAASHAGEHHFELTKYCGTIAMSKSMYIFSNQHATLLDFEIHVGKQIQQVE